MIEKLLYDWPLAYLLLAVPMGALFPLLNHLAATHGLWADVWWYGGVAVMLGWVVGTAMFCGLRFAYHARKYRNNI